MGVILEEDQRVLEIMTSNVVKDNLKTARQKNIRLETQCTTKSLTLSVQKQQEE